MRASTIPLTSLSGNDSETPGSIPGGFSELDQPGAIEIDLNPDLEEDSDSDIGASEGDYPDVDTGAEFGGYGDDLSRQRIANGLHHGITDQSISIEGESGAQVTNQSGIGSEVQGYHEDDHNASSIGPVPSVTLPFDDVYESLLSQFVTPHQVVTDAQQSKFINYLDESLLKVQRQFIKNQVETVEVYSLSDLLRELQVIINVIWVSITKRNKLYGQGDYLIKILGDLEDYVFHYKQFFQVGDPSGGPVIVTEEKNKLIQFFNFFQDLDVKISILMDGFDLDTGLKESLSTTEIVRLTPIASRLRIQLISSLEPVRTLLQASSAHGQADVRGQDVSESQDLLNTLDVEIGRVFEGILERS